MFRCSNLLQKMGNEGNATDPLSSKMESNAAKQLNYGNIISVDIMNHSYSFLSLCRHCYGNSSFIVAENDLISFSSSF